MSNVPADEMTSATEKAEAHVKSCQFFQCYDSLSHIICHFKQMMKSELPCNSATTS